MNTFDPHEPHLQPRGTQLSMTGGDWLSDRDKRHQARAEAARKKAALDCARKLEAAAESLSRFLLACNECRDGSADERMSAGDSRKLLMANLMEYSAWLESKYAK